jgi:predicted protein tyrosine phosphatase
MNNRLGNAKNPYQTEAKKVLCACSAGLLRSPTAANTLHAEYGYNTRAVGVAEDYALVPMDIVHIHWADEVVFVEQKVYDLAWSKFKDKLKDKKVVVLSIPDNFEWNDPDLVAIIKKQYADHFIMAEAF